MFCFYYFFSYNYIISFIIRSTSLLVHLHYRKRLHIHYYYNRDLLEDFEDNLIEGFQYQHITIHQSRNHLMHNHMPKTLWYKEPLYLHKVLSKLLMHLLDQIHHHKHFSIHYSTDIKVDHCWDFTRPIHVRHR